MSDFYPSWADAVGPSDLSDPQPSDRYAGYEPDEPTPPVLAGCEECGCDVEPGDSLCAYHRYAEEQRYVRRAVGA